MIASREDFTTPEIVGMVPPEEILRRDKDWGRGRGKRKRMGLFRGTGMEMVRQVGEWLEGRVVDLRLFL